MSSDNFLPGPELNEFINYKDLTSTIGGNAERIQLTYREQLEKRIKNFSNDVDLYTSKKIGLERNINQDRDKLTIMIEQFNNNEVSLSKLLTVYNRIDQHLLQYASICKTLDENKEKLEECKKILDSASRDELENIVVDMPVNFNDAIDAYMHKYI